MPETFVHTVWADGTERSCYSPSLVVEEFFHPGQAMAQLVAGFAHTAVTS